VLPTLTDRTDEKGGESVKRLSYLASLLAAMLLLTAAPALAQNTAEQDADQELNGDTSVSSGAAAQQGNFTQIATQQQEITSTGDVTALQTQTQTGVQAQVPVSASVNAQQVPVNLAADLELLLELLSG
jgi:lipopolysaccharide assembly outer membrane protein LptD (OstA)